MSPPRAGLTFSVLLRPRDVPPGRRGWLPLLAGLAVADAVHPVIGPVELKWPNDVLARPANEPGPGPGADPGPGHGAAKLCGILAEAAADAVVVGIGLNVSTEAAELPPATHATSLALLGRPDAEREPLLAGILDGLERRYLAWRDAAGDPDRCGLRADYTQACGTLGRQVRVELPGGQPLSGLAVGVDPDGRLLVRVPEGSDVPVAAGDVVHLR
jgi:BirA family biotin operon repressor/biotin-[acetyl-CoA-carboxylase] ligase